MFTMQPPKTRWHRRTLATGNACGGCAAGGAPSRAVPGESEGHERSRKHVINMRKKRHVVAALMALLIAGVAFGAIAISGADAAPARKSAGPLNGAGATFPQPLIAIWQQAYQSAKGVQVNYNGIGSGGGISAITNKTVDFGASDAPLTPDQFSACGGCVQIPWVLSATSVLYNLPGVKNNLHINGKLIADIYLGKVTNWNDARLRALNKGVNLPDKKITPVYRSDAKIGRASCREKV